MVIACLILDRNSLRSVAVLSTGRAHKRRSREKKFQVAPAPISSRFLCPRPPLLLSAPNQNHHATQARIEIAIVPEPANPHEHKLK